VKEENGYGQGRKGEYEGKEKRRDQEEEEEEEVGVWAAYALASHTSWRRSAAP